MKHRGFTGRKVAYAVTSGVCTTVYEGIVRRVRWYQLGTRRMLQVEWTLGGSSWIDAQYARWL